MALPEETIKKPACISGKKRYTVFCRMRDEDWVPCDLSV